MPKISSQYIITGGDKKLLLHEILQNENSKYEIKSFDTPITSYCEQFSTVYNKQYRCNITAFLIADDTIKIVRHTKAIDLINPNYNEINEIHCPSDIVAFKLSPKGQFISVILYSNKEINETRKNFRVYSSFDGTEFVSTSAPAMNTRPENYNWPCAFSSEETRCACQLSGSEARVVRLYNITHSKANNNKPEKENKVNNDIDFINNNINGDTESIEIVEDEKKQVEKSKAENETVFKTAKVTMEILRDIVVLTNEAPIRRFFIFFSDNTQNKINKESVPVFQFKKPTNGPNIIPNTTLIVCVPAAVHSSNYIASNEVGKKKRNFTGLQSNGLIYCYNADIKEIENNESQKPYMVSTTALADTFSFESSHLTGAYGLLKVSTDVDKSDVDRYYGASELIFINFGERRFEKLINFDECVHSFKISPGNFSKYEPEYNVGSNGKPTKIITEYFCTISGMMPPKVQIFKVDIQTRGRQESMITTETVSAPTYLFNENVNLLYWSPCGKYLLLRGDGSMVGLNIILRFNPNIIKKLQNSTDELVEVNESIDYNMCTKLIHGDRTHSYISPNGAFIMYATTKPRYTVNNSVEIFTSSQKPLLQENNSINFNELYLVDWIQDSENNGKYISPPPKMSKKESLKIEKNQKLKSDVYIPPSIRAKMEQEAAEQKKNKSKKNNENNNTATYSLPSNLNVISKKSIDNDPLPTHGKTINNTNKLKTTSIEKREFVGMVRRK